MENAANNGIAHHILKFYIRPVPTRITVIGPQLGSCVIMWNPYRDLEASAPGVVMTHHDRNRGTQWCHLQDIAPIVLAVPA